MRQLQFNRIIVLTTLFALTAYWSLFAQSKKYPIQPQMTAAVGKYNVVDTGQTTFFDEEEEISRPDEGDDFYGQDAQYTGNTPSYVDNRDGTTTDLVTGLIWQKSFEVMTYDEAVEKLKNFSLAGKTDWRLPTIKEAYSLIMFYGEDVSDVGKKESGKGQGRPGFNSPMNRMGPPDRQRPGMGHPNRQGPGMRPGQRQRPTGIEGSGEMSQKWTGDSSKYKPFINTKYFDFEYASNGDRQIDTQILSSTVYRGTTMNGNDTVFGVNVADGRIKGYPIYDPRSNSGKKFTVRFVRGNTEYGRNNFKDNKDGTISDLATGLMWQQADSEGGMDWEEAFEYVEDMNDDEYLGYSDWRLPNAKELQSIVDYSRSPQKTNSPAINPLFKVTEIEDEGDNKNYPFYWSSTTHKNQSGGESAAYVAFGEALGFLKMPGSNQSAKLTDVHGAGAQRSDPKEGSSRNYPQGHGPQGDVIRIDNFVRLVRDMN